MAVSEIYLMILPRFKNIFIGDAYYHLSEFEKSLMFYYRGLHKCQSGSECEDIRYELLSNEI